MDKFEKDWNELMASRQKFFLKKKIFEICFLCVLFTSCILVIKWMI